MRYQGNLGDIINAMISLKKFTQRTNIDHKIQTNHKALQTNKIESKIEKGFLKSNQINPITLRVPKSHRHSQKSLE